MNTFISILGKGFFLIASFFMILVTGISVSTSYKKITNAKGWEKSNSIVTESYIEKYHRSKGISYCPIIMVKYKFENKQIISKLDISDGSCRPFKQLAKNIIKDYKEGDYVMIYINPLKPSDIRLYDYPFSFYSWLMVFLLIIGVLLFIEILRIPIKDDNANKP